MVVPGTAPNGISIRFRRSTASLQHPPHRTKYCVHRGTGVRRPLPNVLIQGTTERPRDPQNQTKTMIWFECGGPQHSPKPKAQEMPKITQIKLKRNFNSTRGVYGLAPTPTTLDQVFCGGNCGHWGSKTSAERADPGNYRTARGPSESN